MLLYVHVPFCRVRCHYCAFYSQPLPSDSRQAIARYERGIIREADIWRDQLHEPVTSVFFGGGTPSLLEPEAIFRILQAVRARFVLMPDAEITMEANPESFTRPGYAEAVRACGITRVSLGIQNLDARFLKLLGRAHDAKQAREAVGLARQAGFASVSLDLMWGLPGQSTPQWLDTLDAAIALNPDHISAYCLTLEPGTALDACCREGGPVMPDEDQLAAMYLQGVQRLEEAGYQQYEISNFARSGHCCAHNRATWRGEDYLGLGPSAVSTLGASRLTNPADLRSWEQQVDARQHGNEEKLDPITLCLEKAMLALRTREGMDLEWWQKSVHATGLPDLDALLLAELCRSGYLKLSDHRIALTRQGMLIGDAIIERLLPFAS